jgi:O-antigen ligase
MFKQYPKFGSGFNGFSIAHANEHWSDTHNFYLKTLCEQGIIGCFLLLLVLVGALRSGWKLFRIGGTAFQRGLGLGFFGCVIAHIVTNIFGDRFSYFEMGAYFWVFWGLVDRGMLMAREAINIAPNVEQGEGFSSSMKNEDVKRGMK